MRLTLVVICCSVFIPLTIFSQHAIDTTPGKMAIVNVTVTNMKGQPRSGEAVVFKGENTGRFITGYSDAMGKLRQKLPPGDTYVVSLKSIADTTKYTSLVVPKLEADEIFTEDFWVKIQFEPARKYRLDNVHFDIDKATLRAGSEVQLLELFDYLDRHPGIKIEIAGHTDNSGNGTHNLRLSQQRADTIRDWLLKKGISSSQITAKGYGATQPVADNSTIEGKQLNRRTEVRMLN